MHIVHLVGNGFDIKAGLRTEAKTLINEIVENNIDKDIPNYAKNLLNTINDEGIDTWADYEFKLGEYSSNELVGDDPVQYVEAKAFFDKCLTDALRERSKLVSASFIEENALDCINSLSNIFNILPEGKRRAFFKLLGNPVKNTNIFHSFATFNYTPVLAKMINKCRQKGGRLNDSNSRFIHNLNKFQYAHSNIDSFPVCGVDGIEQIANESFRNNYEIVNTVLKESTQVALGSEDHLKVQRMIDTSDVVTVFGMSFGQTDLRWWQYIVDKMSAGQCKALIIFEHGIDLNSGVPLDMVRTESEVKKKFLNAACCENREETEKLASRIFVASSNDILPIIKPLKPVI